MKRDDDFNVRRKKLAGMSDGQLYAYFWELTAKVVDPLLELGMKNTSPSIERSVLLRMGIASPDTKVIVDGCIDRGLMGKGAGHVVYRLSKHKNIGIKEAAAMLVNGSGWDEAAALFKK
ncbi:MAG: ornithine aminomutase subunit alpha [Spirochaetaceae bacterium]|nr:ornithine aminomutase subunit alpha [Spirochaetaceae bacterium]